MESQRYIVGLISGNTKVFVISHQYLNRMGIWCLFFSKRTPNNAVLCQPLYCIRLINKENLAFWCHRYILILYIGCLIVRPKAKSRNIWHQLSIHMAPEHIHDACLSPERPQMMPLFRSFIQVNFWSLLRMCIITKIQCDAYWRCIVSTYNTYCRYL